jgi:tetratricopeptide (TPR) repeat protein
MTIPRGFWVWIFLACWLISTAAGAAWAKNRGNRAHVAHSEEKAEKKSGKKTVKKTKKGKKAEAEAEAAPAPASAQAQEIDDPKVLLSRAREQEKGGDISGCLQSLVKFVNVYPLHPERAAILQRMAQLAQDRGQTEKALQIYALEANLYPRTQAAAAARWQMQTLEFSQNLRERDPMASFKDYLQKCKSRPQAVSPEKLREPLRQGWQGVERVLRRSSPCPVHLVEEALTLWELHPQGTQPPEAALILGELLQEKGLYGEARNFLQRAREQGTPELRLRALVGLLEGAWATRNLPDFAATWMLWRRHREEISPELKTRLAKLPLPEEFFSPAVKGGQEEKPEADAVSALLDWWNGKAPDASQRLKLLQCLGHFLKRPLPPAIKEILLLQLAQLRWFQGQYPQAARIYQQLLAANAKGENSAFYQDRLALSQLQGRQQEAALQIYRGLSQEGDNFWQLVSRTRLADVELGRLQTEPPQ